MQSPFLNSPVQLAVDPLLLAMAGRAPADSARALREAVPSLNAAWLVASRILFAQRTGAALQDCEPALQRALGGCVAELASVSSALESSATLYFQADGLAVPASR